MGDSPAEKYGAKRGDAIVSIDDEPMESVNEVGIVMASVLQAGGKMEVEVRRAGKIVKLTMKRNSTEFSGNALVDGLQFDLQPMLCAGFPTISNIEKHSQASKLGLEVKDV